MATAFVDERRIRNFQPMGSKMWVMTSVLTPG
jgi:hypothetical protein